MAKLSSDLISQFVKATKDTKTEKKDIYVYGTVDASSNNKYVILDGSQFMTPVSGTTEAGHNERVMVLLKNHTATIVGNISSPSAGVSTVTRVVGENVSEFEKLVADKATIAALEVEKGRISDLEADNITINGKLDVHFAEFGTIKTNVANITERLIAAEGVIDNFSVDTLDGRYAKIESLDAINATINDLKSTSLSSAVIESTYAKIETLNATNAIVNDLKANSLTAKDIEGKYANIDFSNITKATMAEFYAKSGLIQNAVIGDTTISGELVGVTISGNLIKAGTLIADKLVIQGENGLYYKLNTDGVKTEANQTDYNSLNGDIITVKSITASKISVSDLVAFGATIGGFKITENSIYSGVKSSVGNTTRGVYLDNTGQIAFGDASNFIKYYKDTDGNYKLGISADDIKLGSKSVKTIMSGDPANYSKLNQNTADYWGFTYDSTEDGNWYTLKTLKRDTYISHEYECTGGEQFKVEFEVSSSARAVTVRDSDNIEYANINVGLYCMKDSGGHYVWPSILGCVSSEEATPTKASGIITIPEDAKKFSIAIQIAGWNSFSGTVKIRNLRISKLGAINDRLFVAESKIIQNANGITALVTRTESVEDKFGNYSTTSEMNSAIEQKANSIKNTVSETYATKEALDSTKTDIDNLEIGGRNLFTNTNNGKAGWGMNRKSGAYTVTTEEMLGVYGASIDITETSDNWSIITFANSNILFDLLRPNTEYTLSFDVYSTVQISNTTINIRRGDATLPFMRDVSIPAIPAETWTHVCVKLVTLDELPEVNEQYVYWSKINDIGTYKICNLKMEKGNRGTAWTPAPEDVESDIAGLNTRIGSAESTITQLSDRITANVTETQNLNTRMSTVEHTADDITVRFEPFGGRNYIAKSIFGTATEHKKYSSSGTLERTEEGLKLTYNSDTARNGFVLPLAFDGCLENGQTYTLSFKYRTNMENIGTIYVLQRTTPNVNVSGGAALTPSETEWKTFSHTFSSASINDRICYGILLPYALGTDSWIEIKDKTIKLEKGTKATTWIPAPEDGVTAATNYLSLSSSGLIVGQNPTNPTAGNVLVSSNGVTIRKGTTILSEFKAATRTVSGVSSATLTSSDSTDSESDGITSVRGTVTSNETRSTIYITTDGNPVYFPKGIETDKVLINNSSGIIANCNLLLTGSLVDRSGEGILTPLNSYGNMVIGYGRFQDGGGTYVYGTLVKAKTKNGFSASVNGVSALDTNNDAGNATFGWHLYEAGTGETNIYGQITSLFSKGDMRLNADGNSIRFNGSLIPYNGNKFNIGTSSYSLHNIYISSNDDNTLHGLKFSNTSGEHNAVGVNADGYQIFGNSSFCTNIVTKSTTTSSTGYSFKITCGENPSLTLDDDDARLFLFGGTDSTSRYLGSMAIYKRTYSNAGNIYITNNGMMGRSTSSSQRYKKDIVDLPLDDVKGLYELPVRQFKYRTEYISADDERYERSMPGFIAEEVDEYLPIACDHIEDQNGNLIPEMWNSKIIIPALLKLIQDLNDRVKGLEERRD